MASRICLTLRTPILGPAHGHALGHAIELISEITLEVQQGASTLVIA